MLECTQALLLRAVPMLEEGTMASLFTSAHLCVIRDPWRHAAPAEPRSLSTTR
jgi:hypothetical protein